MPYYSALKCFLEKSGPKKWGPPNWLKFGTRIHCYMLITILKFIFLKFLSSISFGQILSQSSPNWLEFGTAVHCYMLITILKFLFSKLFSFIFFGQIWPENSKFLKLTEISWRGTLLYACNDFNVYFFKVFVSHMFLAKFRLKIWSSPYWLNFGAGALYYYKLITILMFIF